eukprot:11786197-Ditylum_brightwellii.AAC.1
MEFPMPTGIEAKKLEDKEISELLENGSPTSWKFQMDKEGFGVSSSMIKKIMETCVCYKECKPKEIKKSSTACKSHSMRGGKGKAKHKASKNLTLTGDKILHNIIPMAGDITIASTMGIVTTPQKTVGSPSISAKDTSTMKGRTDPVRARRCISAVARSSLVGPCSMETKIYTQSLMRKLPRLLTARKRMIST